MDQLDEVVKSVEEPWREIPDITEDSHSTGTGQHHPQDISSTQETTGERKTVGEVAKRGGEAGEQDTDRRSSSYIMDNRVMRGVVPLILCQWLSVLCKNLDELEIIDVRISTPNIGMVLAA